MKKEFQSIQILHAALLLGSLLFFLVANFLGDFELVQHLDDSDSILVYIIIVLVPICIATSRFMNKQLLASFKDDDSIQGKMDNYKNRVILRSALIEGPILFAAVVVLLDSHLYAAIMFVIGWGALLLIRPTLEEFAADYGLTSQEKNEVNKS